MAKKKEKTEEAPVAEAKPVAPPPPTKAAKVKIPKLAPKNKSRLPRKQKKALAKASKTT